MAAWAKILLELHKFMVQENWNLLSYTQIKPKKNMNSVTHYEKLKTNSNNKLSIIPRIPGGNRFNHLFFRWQFFDFFNYRCFITLGKIRLSNCPGKCPGQVFIGRWLGVYLGRGHQSGRRIRNNGKCSPTPKSLLLKNATRWFAWRKKHIVFVRLKKIVIPKETVNSRIHPFHTWNFLHHWRQPTSNLQEICIATPSRSLTFSMENNCWF